jgi:hypothetical protein
VGGGPRWGTIRLVGVEPPRSRNECSG